ncbi:methyltransferase domain-containing protein [archaeon]|nr:methyltransferase domain-containing protein [archaeon]
MKVFLIHASGKTLFRDWRGEDVQTSWGEVPRQAIQEAVDQNKAVSVETAKGERFVVMKPLLRDSIQNAERGARPLYEYDAAVAAALMSLDRDTKLLEAGSGSGCATMVFAQLAGKVVSLEREERFHEVAKRNLEGIENVELKQGDLFEAKFDEESFDAVFLDLKEDVKAVKKSASWLKRGHFMCVFSPVEAKVQGCVSALQELGFVNIEVVHLGLRRHSPGGRLTPCFPGFFVLGRRF